MSKSSWRKIPVSLTELCIDTTLRCGQSFRWRKSEDDIWSCALHGRLLSLRQDSSHLYYRAQWPSLAARAPLTPPSSQYDTDVDEKSGEIPHIPDDDDTESLIRHYLNLTPNLSSLYSQWSAADPNFAKKAPRFTGVRILRQDAWEALVGFICSSNNNIARISQMVDKLCANYGALAGVAGGREFYDMPTPHALADPRVEAHLRELGFGYRARYLHRTAVIIAEEKDPGWLDGLRNPEAPAFASGVKPSTAGEMAAGGREGYREAHEELLALQGVGPKVADCVCLMGLGWGEAVPVDTHVWQIAVRDYRFGRGKHASLTKATYDAVGDHFRKLWGKEAGWAHSVLFTADLRQFAERLRAQIEVKEEVVETNEDVVVKTEQTVKTEVISPAKTKRKRAVGLKAEPSVTEQSGEEDEALDTAIIEKKTTARTARANKRRRAAD